MRKIYLSLLSLFLLLTVNIKINAQVSIYILAQSSGTYTSVTGGTVVATAIANADAAASGIICLGNSFRFGKKKYLSNLESGRDYQNFSTNLKLCL